jgi:hypothetical protein
VGVVALISLVAGGLIWRRRKKSNAVSQPGEKRAFYNHDMHERGIPTEIDGYSPAELTAASLNVKDTAYYSRRQELESRTRPQELPS